MLAALLTLLAAAPAAPAPANAAPSPTASPATTPATTAATTTPPTTPEAPESGVDVVIDAVLPCGLRVLTARDMSLPVAAVVLAVESGSEDDPPEAPGLVHALAYQVLQGNRELRPGETIAITQDAGGLHGMSTGVSQVRYESLVPVTRLDAVLWAESQRLRFPTAAPQRWEQALGWAAADERSGSRLRPEALAFVHGSTGLAHDGRAVGKQLAALVEGVLAAQLASKFNYGRATLVVVGPEAPERLLARISPLFAGLPQARRMAPLRRVGPRPSSPTKTSGPTGGLTADALTTDGLTTDGLTGALPTGVLAAPATEPAPKDMSKTTSAPAPSTMSSGTGVTVPLSRQRGYTFVWPVPPTPAAGAWAAALCRAINRQKKGPEPDEPRKARLGCDYEADPRRGVLIMRPSNAEDPWALVRARLARLAPGAADAALLQGQAAVIAQALRLARRTPLGLAIQLAQVPADEPTSPQASFTRQHRVDELTGAAAMLDPASLQREAPGFLRVEDAIVLTYPEDRP